ncbi:hypothetical protein, variant [Exophiala oligosperma]|uniref:Uncharacterized protein n=1 Tax=Exophiala oligosperma TaxID=215243 RepID=A0A0D2A8R5_9EURO|nr:hypothetical protein, variant [Exophiala oligosperma]KIW36716.1 hypothetical protein, variant [Exophiala oligosperma]
MVVRSTRDIERYKQQSELGDTERALTTVPNDSLRNQWSVDTTQTPRLAELLNTLGTLRFVHQDYSLGDQLQRSDGNSVAVRINLEGTDTKSLPGFLDDVATILQRPAPTVRQEHDAFRSHMKPVLMSQSSSLARLRHLIVRQKLACRLLYTFGFLVTWQLWVEGHGHPGVYLETTVNVLSGAITDKKVFDRAGRSLNTRASLLELMSRDFRSVYSLYLGVPPTSISRLQCIRIYCLRGEQFFVLLSPAREVSLYGGAFPCRDTSVCHA